MGNTNSQEKDVNLGIYDGEVAHPEVNGSISCSDKIILLGEQTRLPFFPNDQRLPKLHSGDPLVQLFWKVLHKIPSHVRTSLIMSQVSITLVSTESLLYFRDYRHHQAVHIGRRRRTIYLPEILLRQAEAKGYDYWAVAEGVIFAGWMLLDYLLLVDVLKAFGKHADGKPTMRLSEAHVYKFAHLHNTHRCHHPQDSKSEIAEFVQGYKSRLKQVEAINVLSDEPYTIARELFDSDLEQFWARYKMERIADIFDYPNMFMFDRDIIHGAAREVAESKGQDIAPQNFSDLLHDYRDAMRFDSTPLMTTFCKGIVPKPRAQFLESLVDLGMNGLEDFFIAYSKGVCEVLDLMNPLWVYLCSLSSDPAGVWTRVGRCRALARSHTMSGMDRALAGIYIRLDLSESYRRFADEFIELGEVGKDELLQVVELHHLRENDEWVTFRTKKQTIVACACNLLDKIEGGDSDIDNMLGERYKLHQDECVKSVLENNPHRQTSDPSGVLMYVRTYRSSLSEFGPADPDTNFFLASLLIRFDLSKHYPYLLTLLPKLGSTGISALYDVLENLSERNVRYRAILDQARTILCALLLSRRLRIKARDRAENTQVGEEVSNNRERLDVRIDHSGTAVEPGRKEEVAVEKFVSLKQDLGRTHNSFDHQTCLNVRQDEVEASSVIDSGSSGVNSG